MRRITSRIYVPAPRVALIAALTALLLTVAACGDGESGPGNGTDVAFVADMVPHHDSAIAMAKVAQKRGQSDYVRTLADGIVRSQQSEITVMNAIGHDLEDVKAADLGLGKADMGMDMDASMLADAKPFDREFIDMMIPHHQGAIRMARVEKAKGKSAALKDVADDVIEAQTQEINEMNAYRKKTFGAPSPAGGVPAEDEAGGGGGGTTTDHDGHAGMDGM